MAEKLDGLGGFLKEIEASPGRLMEELIRKANRHAETLAGLTREGTPVGGGCRWPHSSEYSGIR